MEKNVIRNKLKSIGQEEMEIYELLRDSYIETCKDACFRTARNDPMNFRDFLVIHLNYTIEEANEITQIYELALC